MKTVSYHINRRKHPSRGLSAMDYVAKEDLDFYYDTTKYDDVFRAELEDYPVTRIYDLIWRGDLGKFPQLYFDTITKDKKCEELLRYVYIDLYHFSKNEIITMSHRKFLNDIKLSYICTSGLFPNYKSIIAKILNIDERLLHGRKSLDITNRRTNKCSINTHECLSLNTITNTKSNKTHSNPRVCEINKYKNLALNDINKQDNKKIPIGINNKIFGQEKKDYLMLKSILHSRNINDRYSAIKFLILNKRVQGLISVLQKKYGSGIGLPQLLFPDLTIEEYNRYRDDIEKI